MTFEVPIWPARRMIVYVARKWMPSLLAEPLIYQVSENALPLAEMTQLRAAPSPFPARALRSEPGVAPFMTFDE